MKKELIYLIGQPGSGKSTVAAELFKRLPCGQKEEPFAHIVYPNAIQLGAQRESFSGTDALPMNVQPKVVPMMKDTDCQYFFGEGDRLANEKFFLAVAGAGIRLRVFFLRTSNATAAERREKRGSKQDVTWLKGRITKVNNLWRTWGITPHTLNGEQEPEQIVAKMKKLTSISQMTRR